MDVYWILSGEQSLLEGLLNVANYGLGFYVCYLLIQDESKAWFQA